MLLHKTFSERSIIIFYKQNVYGARNKHIQNVYHILNAFELCHSSIAFGSILIFLTTTSAVRSCAGACTERSNSTQHWKLNRKDELICKNESRIFQKCSYFLWFFVPSWPLCLNSNYKLRRSSAFQKKDGSMETSPIHSKDDSQIINTSIIFRM